MKPTVYFPTRLRGFFRQLIKAPEINAEFSYQKQNIYETNSLKMKILIKIGRSRLLDFLGYIQVIKSVDVKSDIVGSFNRFVKTDKPYFIYIENPTALYHYRLGRKESFLGRKRLKHLISNQNLRGLVFMSEACASTFEEVCTSVPKRCIKETIYPYIPKNPLVTSDSIIEKNSTKEINLLFIAQGTRFLSKGALEVLESFKRLRKKGYLINLHMITSFRDVDGKILSAFSAESGITLSDFNFSFDEMQNIYATNHILLQPTSDESFGLTILEAIKSGLPVIGSRLYAIPEMVENGVNGFLCDPHYWFFSPDNIPNPKVWNNRETTIYSGSISKEIICFLEEKIEYLINNRELLNNMALNSLKKANTPPFSEEYITNQWNDFLSKMLK